MATEHFENLNITTVHLFLYNNTGILSPYDRSGNFVSYLKGSANNTNLTSADSIRDQILNTFNGDDMNNFLELLNLNKTHHVNATIQDKIPSSNPLGPPFRPVSPEVEAINTQKKNNSDIIAGAFVGGFLFILLGFTFLHRRRQMRKSTINRDNINSRERFFGGKYGNNNWRVASSHRSSLAINKMAADARQDLFLEYGMTIQPYGAGESPKTEPHDDMMRNFGVKDDIDGYGYEQGPSQEGLLKSSELFGVNLESIVEVDSSDSDVNGTNPLFAATNNSTTNLLPASSMSSYAPSDEDECSVDGNLEQIAEDQYPIPPWQPPITGSSISKVVDDEEATYDLSYLDTPNECALSTPPELESGDTNDNTPFLASSPGYNMSSCDVVKSADYFEDGNTATNACSTKRRLFVSLEADGTAALPSTDYKNYSDDDTIETKGDSIVLEESERGCNKQPERYSNNNLTVQYVSNIRAAALTSTDDINNSDLMVWKDESEVLEQGERCCDKQSESCANDNLTVQYVSNIHPMM